MSINKMTIIFLLFLLYFQDLSYPRIHLSNWLFKIGLIVVFRILLLWLLFIAFILAVLDDYFAILVDQNVAVNFTIVG